MYLVIPSNLWYCVLSEYWRYTSISCKFHETLLTVLAVLPFHSNQRVWDQEPIPNLQLPRRRCIQCSRTYVYKTIAYSILIHGIVYLFILRRSQNDQERSCINEIKELVLTLYQGGRGCVSLFGREVGLLHLASYLKDYLEISQPFIR